MILTRSPYYVYVDWVAPSTDVATEYDLELFIFDDLTAVPATPTYIINKKNIESLTSGMDRVNISRICNSYIDNNPVPFAATELYSQGMQKWIKAQVRYYTETSSDFDTPDVILEDSICNGYSYGIEGENFTSPLAGALIPVQDYKVGRNSIFSFPVKAGAVSQSVTVKSYPDLNIDFSTSFTSTDFAYDEVQGVGVLVSEALTDEYIEIKIGGSTLTTTLLITDECRYTPLDVLFINRYGVQQTITMFKARTDSMAVTNDEYETNYFQPQDGYHQFPTYNVQAKSSFKINSGFVKEEMNEVFKQLFLSEKVWIYENDITTPVNLKSKTLEYKTRAKDRLINYELEFEYSFNEINNI